MLTFFPLLKSNHKRYIKGRSAMKGRNLISDRYIERGKADKTRLATI